MHAPTSILGCSRQGRASDVRDEGEESQECQRVEQSNVDDSIFIAILTSHISHLTSVPLLPSLAFLRAPTLTPPPSGLKFPDDSRQDHGPQFWSKLTCPARPWIRRSHFDPRIGYDVPVSLTGSPSHSSRPNKSLTTTSYFLQVTRSCTSICRCGEVFQ